MTPLVATDLTVFQHIADLLGRLPSYPWWEVLIELVVIWALVYVIFRFVQGTRAAGALKGIVLVFFVIALLVWVLGGGDAFSRIGFLFDRLLAVVAIALVVIFQPELRRALIRLGETPFFRSNPSEIAHIVDAVVEASRYLAKARFGAIIVLERRVGLEHLVEGGTPLNAEVSARLLQTIFYPGSALHDLAVLIRGRVVHAAGVQLPMAEPGEMPDVDLGARHRAAVGLSKECDAVVLVVSEETGAIRIAERGRLTDPIDPEKLADELGERLRKGLAGEAKTGAEQEEADAAMLPQTAEPSEGAPPEPKPDAGAEAAAKPGDAPAGGEPSRA